MATSQQDQKLGETTMLFDELLRDILNILPDATMEEDTEGQLVIYTNSMLSQDGSDKIVPFTSEKV